MCKPKKDSQIISISAVVFLAAAGVVRLLASFAGLAAETGIVVVLAAVGGLLGALVIVRALARRQMVFAWSRLARVPEAICPRCEDVFDPRDGFAAHRCLPAPRLAIEASKYRAPFQAGEYQLDHVDMDQAWLPPTSSRLTRPGAPSGG